MEKSSNELFVQVLEGGMIIPRLLGEASVAE
jgi:hypothetical protein